MATERRTAEEVWRELRPHLEWAAGFSLIFLYAGHPRTLAALRERLSDSLQLRTLRLQVLSPGSPAELERLVQAILAARPQAPAPGPYGSSFGLTAVIRSGDRRAHASCTT